MTDMLGRLIECTGISASWCPIHGDCACPRNSSGETISDDGEDFAKNSERCPLHAPWSDHGERVIVKTAWGDVLLSDPS